MSKRLANLILHCKMGTQAGRHTNLVDIEPWDQVLLPQKRVVHDGCAIIVSGEAYRAGANLKSGVLHTLIVHRSFHCGSTGKAHFFDDCPCFSLARVVRAGLHATSPALKRQGLQQPCHAALSHRRRVQLAYHDCSKHAPPIQEQQSCKSCSHGMMDLPMGPCAVFVAQEYSG